MSLAIKENPTLEKNIVSNQHEEYWELPADEPEEIETQLEDEAEPTPDDVKELTIAVEKIAVEDASWSSTAMQAAESVIDIYFLSLRNYPLLSSEEFTYWYGLYEKGVKAAEKKDAIMESRALSENEERELEPLIAEGNDAKNAILCGHLRFVVYIAKRYQDMGIDFADLIQEGNQGLMDALPRFDYGRGYAFTTYAYFRIRQRITLLIANQSRTIRVPVHPGTRLSNLLRTTREYEARTGTKPSPEDLVQEGFELAEQESLEHLQSLQPISLNVKLNSDDGSGSELEEVVPDLTAISPEQQLELNEIVREIFRCLSLYHRGNNPNRDKQIFLRYHGIYGDQFDWEFKQSPTYAVLAEQFGMSRARAQQIVVKVIKHIVRVSYHQRLATGSSLLWDLYELGVTEGYHQ